MNYISSYNSSTPSMSPAPKDIIVSDPKYVPCKGIIVSDHKYVSCTHGYHCVWPQVCILHPRVSLYLITSMSPAPNGIILSDSKYVSPAPKGIIVSDHKYVSCTQSESLYLIPSMSPAPKGIIVSDPKYVPCTQGYYCIWSQVCLLYPIPSMSPAPKGIIVSDPKVCLLHTRVSIIVSDPKYVSCTHGYHCVWPQVCLLHPRVSLYLTPSMSPAPKGIYHCIWPQVCLLHTRVSIIVSDPKYVSCTQGYLPLYLIPSMSPAPRGIILSDPKYVSCTQGYHCIWDNQPLSYRALFSQLWPVSIVQYYMIYSFVTDFIICDKHVINRNLHTIDTWAKIYAVWTAIF